MPITDRQKQVLDLYNKIRTMSGVARELGINRQAVRKSLRAARRYQEADPGVQDAVDQTGLSMVSASHGWRRVQDPDTGSWNSVFWKNPDAAHDEAQSWAEIFREALVDAPSSLPVKPPAKASTEMLPRYIVADVHFGMLAWDRETGEDYDLRIAANRLANCMGTLLESTPTTERALILNLGDTVHSNDQSNATPASGHVLDVDSRFGKIVYEAVKAQVAQVEAAKSRHQHVEVVILSGNHDPDVSHMLAIAMIMRFKDDPRVTVHWHPAKLWAMQFGRNLLSAHHGDRTKPERLALQVADDYAQLWGQTYWRYLDTGHIHHDNGRDIGGIYWQSHRALTGRDAAAAGMGYTARRSMKAITVHADRGEVLRNTAGIG